MWCIYNGISSFCHKKKEILPFVMTWVDFESIMPSEVVHSEEANTECSCLYGESKKADLIQTE